MTGDIDHDATEVRLREVLDRALPPAPITLRNKLEEVGRMNEETGRSRLRAILVAGAPVVAVLIIAGLLVASGRVGPGSGAGSSAAQSTAPSSYFVRVAGSGSNPASDPITLSQGSYSVHWSVNPGSDGGCYWYLYVGRSLNGPPTAQIASMALPDGLAHEGEAGITILTTDAYIIQEDEIGPGCHRAWSAEISQP